MEPSISGFAIHYSHALPYEAIQASPFYETNSHLNASFFPISTDYAPKFAEINISPEDRRLCIWQVAVGSIMENKTAVLTVVGSRAGLMSG